MYWHKNIQSRVVESSSVYFWHNYICPDMAASHLVTPMFSQIIWHATSTVIVYFAERKMLTSVVISYYVIVITFP